MKRYSGSKADDPKPIGGGAYNKDNCGGEICNFKKGPGRRYFGFVRPSGRRYRLNLKRIDPVSNSDSLPDVLVVFVARIPRLGGQRVVGWYRNAIVTESPKRSPFFDRASVVSHK